MKNKKFVLFLTFILCLNFFLINEYDNNVLKNEENSSNSSLIINKNIIKNYNLDIMLHNTSIENKQEIVNNNTSIENKQEIVNNNTSIENKQEIVNNNTSIENKQENINNNTSIENKQENINNNTSIENKQENINNNTSIENKQENIILNNKITSSKNELYLKDKDGFYNYCPTIIKDNNMIHSFYCSNENAFEVIDHIYYRKSVEYENGFIFYDEIKILSPSSNGWDSVHVCDPSVVSGLYTYNNTNYNYLMAYLGCNTYDNQQNKIGFAVSNSLEKDWVKTTEINPIISIPYNINYKDCFQWGVGQPSLINLDNKGTTLIFYTQGTYNLTSQIVELWDLSNLNNPIQLWTTSLSNKGTNDFISNADFVYKDNILYMTCDVHPFGNGILSNIPNKTNIYKTYINDIYNKNSFVDCKWEIVYTLDENTTSYKKNHNTCFVRDKFGYYIDNYVCYSYAIEKNNFSNSLWTYRFKLKEF